MVDTEKKWEKSGVIIGNMGIIAKLIQRVDIEFHWNKIMKIEKLF